MHGPVRALGLLLTISTLIAAAWTSAAADSKQSDAPEEAQLLQGTSLSEFPFASEYAGITVPPGPFGDIAFASNRPGGDTDGDYDIYTSLYAGAQQTRRTDAAGDDTSPQWSPDGEAIAFTSDRDGNDEVYVMHPSGTDQTNLTDHPADDRAPTWSPDGTKVAFASNRTGDWEIYVMDISAKGGPSADISRSTEAKGDPSGGAVQSGPSGGAVQITNITDSPETDNAFPDWSPTGERIAFIRDGDIWTMNADGSDPVEVHDAPAGVVGRASFKPDTHAFLFSIEGDPHVWLVWEDGTNHQHVVLGRDGDWGPTSYRIIFAFDDEIQSADMMGGEQGVVTSNDFDDMQPDWRWAGWVLPNTPTPTDVGTPAFTATNTQTPGPPTSTPTSTNTPVASTPTPTPPALAGDANCDGSVNAIDAALILQLTASLLDALSCPANADVNGDGRADAVDAALILQYTAGLIGAP